MGEGAWIFSMGECKYMLSGWGWVENIYGLVGVGGSGWEYILGGWRLVGVSGRGYSF